jgi:hypothetical protein
VRTDKPAGKLILISVTCCDVRSGKRIEVLLLLRMLTSHIASAVFFSVFGIYVLKYFMIWRSWLRHCATSQKVAGTIPDGVIGIYLLRYSFRPHYCPGVDRAYDRNEYQE